MNYFRTPGADLHAFPLYTMEDAVRLKEHILRTFEAVDKNPTLMEQGALTFCVVGGGSTGVEIAGRCRNCCTSSSLRITRIFPWTRRKCSFTSSHSIY